MDFKLKKSNLDFRVYTATSTPATGKENDIAIISETPMKNWVLSPDAPSGVPRNDGDLWLQYSVAGGTFNTLKNNAMMIAMRKAWQYVNGTWTEKKAMIHQSGEWVWLTSFLYKRGEIGIGGVPVQVEQLNTNDVVELRDGYIYINLNGTVRNRAAFPEAVDFSKYSTMTAIITVPAKWNTSSALEIGVDSSYQLSTLYKSQYLNNCAVGTEYTFTLDVSDYNEVSNPWFKLTNGTGNGEVKAVHVLEIILE